MGIYDRDYYQADQLRPVRPWDNRTMVTMLIVANVIVFVANFLLTSRSNQLVASLALYSENLGQPWQWFRLITYGFGHRDVFHILFNMVSLYFLGRNVEDKYGKWEFLRFYLVAILLGGIVWCVLRGGGPGGSLLGASGGTTAVAMLFVFSFPQATLYVYGAIPVKAWVLGISIVVFNVFGTNAFVAYDVHLVGAAWAAVYFYGQLNLAFAGRIFADAGSRIKRQRSGLKVHRPSSDSSSAAAETRDDRESDRILDKIHRQGQDSLTAKEREFMERYSREVRQRRQGAD